MKKEKETSSQDNAPHSQTISRRSMLYGIAICGSSPISLSVSHPATAQQTTTQAKFTQTYGGSGDDRPRSIIQTNDGGYALAGVTSSFGSGGNDMWLVKTDAKGIKQFSRTYGGSDNDNAWSLIQTTGGGFAIAGATKSFGAGEKDVWLVKTDAQGDEQFSQTYGGSGNDEARAMVQTKDGGYALAGWTRSFGPGNQNFWLIKTDAQGNEQFTQAYGGDQQDVGRSVVQTTDSGFAIAGRTESFGAGGRDFWLVKTDARGNEEFTRTYGGSNRDNAASLIQTRDGGYVLVGNTRSFGAGSNDFWLVKADSTGEEQFSKAYGGSNNDNASSVVQTPDGGFVIAGTTESFGTGAKDIRLVKTDTQGNEQFSQTYGGGGSDAASWMIQTQDGGFAITGKTNSFGAGNYDFWLVKLPLFVDVTGGGNAAQDLDDDGLYEDINGDGAFDIRDVAALLTHFDDPEVTNNAALFDFNNDGGVNIVDVATLLKMV